MVNFKKGKDDNMKLFQKTVSLVVAVVLALGGARVFAASGNLEQGAADDAVTVLTISIGTAGLDFKEDVQIEVINGDTDERYLIPLSVDTGYRAQRPVRRGSIYEVIVGFKSTDKYNVVSTDTGEAFTSVITAKASIAIELEVRARADLIAPEQESKKRELQVEGAILLAEYNKKLDAMKDNAAFIRSVETFGLADSSIRQYYLKSSDYASAERWSAMDNFERYSVHNIYVAPKMSIMTPNSPITKEETFLSRSVNIQRQYLIEKDAVNGLAMADAMEAIMRWNWANWQDCKIFIDLWEDIPADETATAETVPAIVTTSAVDTATSDITTAISTVAPSASTEKQLTGIAKVLHNFGALFKENIFSVVLIALLGGAFLIVRLVNQKRKADEDNDSLT